MDLNYYIGWYDKTFYCSGNTILLQSDIQCPFCKFDLYLDIDQFRCPKYDCFSKNRYILIHSKNVEWIKYKSLVISNSLINNKTTMYSIINEASIGLKTFPLIGFLLNDDVESFLDKINKILVLL